MIEKVKFNSKDIKDLILKPRKTSLIDRLTLDSKQVRDLVGDEGFEESEHPRNPDGTFGNGGETSTPESKSEALSKLENAEEIPMGKEYTGVNKLNESWLNEKRFKMPKPVSESKWKKLPVEEIPIETATVAQNYLSRNKVKFFMENDPRKYGAITAVKLKDGSVIVIDGTHRFIAGKLLGLKDMPMKFNPNPVEEPAAPIYFSKRS